MEERVGIFNLGRRVKALFVCCLNCGVVVSGDLHLAVRARC
ncbi:hypothetical protein QC760_11094 [Botrytis cinerea]